MATALLLLRVVVGLALVGHGTQKLFGWLGAAVATLLLRRSGPAQPTVLVNTARVGEAA